MNATLLIIDDESSVRRSLTRVFEDGGFTVLAAGSASEGLIKAQSQRPQVVLLDHHLPDGEGPEVLVALREIDPRVRVIMITAYGNTDLAVRSIKSGAYDFITKPYDLERVRHVVDSARREFETQHRLHLYRIREDRRGATRRIMGESPALLEVLAILEKVASSDATSVLVGGESGTGKELVARAIHDLSERRNAPFMDLNCSTFSDSLLENELFGHEKGAFTDAREPKLGLVELTDGGTLFLDEVADMPLATQAKLLRFLDSRSFKRVGGTRDFDVDIRVIAASNKDIAGEIRAGRFREDLFYRLKVVSIRLPALRDRGDDVLLLAQNFLDEFSRKFKRSFRTLSPGAIAALRRYSWPGNVRELRNVIERAVLLEDGEELTTDHLPAEFAREDRRDVPRELGLPSLQAVEDEYVIRVLGLTGGNKSQTARVLGISRQSLLDRLKRIEERSGADETGSFPHQMPSRF